MFRTAILSGHKLPLFDSQENILDINWTFSISAWAWTRRPASIVTSPTRAGVNWTFFLHFERKS